MRVRAALAMMLSSVAAPCLAQSMASQGHDAASTEAGNDVVVMGEKADRTLRDTPASVAVTTGQTIADQNLIDMYDVLQRAPNVAINADRTSFTIRGIDAFYVSGAGDGALASVYLDGAVLPRAALNTGPLDLYDIAQVEVFRGPQSTVQGRNALAGAVVIRTTDPSYEWNGKARVMLTGPDGQRRAAAALGGPILGDQIAFRLAGEIARSDGLLYNTTLHRDADPRQSETLRGKLLFTPDAVPGLRIIATYMHDRHVRGAYSSEFAPPYARRDRIVTEDVATNTRALSDIATLEAHYTLGGGFDLSSITNYSNVRALYIADPDRNPTPGQLSRTSDPARTAQQEVRLGIDLPWVQGLIGAYYLREDNRDYRFEATQNLNLTRLGVDRQLLALGLSQPLVDTVLGLYGGVVPIRNLLTQPRLTRNLAGFTDLTFPLTTRLKLRAGLRYDNERQMRGASQSVALNGTLPDPARLPVPALAPIVTRLNALLVATAAGATSVDPTRAITYDAWLPKLGLTWDVTSDASLSATAQRGYRAGGAGINQQRGQSFTYAPEYTWNYEVALRSDWFDRRLSFNANAYYIDWRDQQVSVQLTPGAVFDTQVVNAGKSRLYGFEAELRGRPTRHLDLYAGIGHSRTEFLDFTVPIGTAKWSATGNEFANAPRWTASWGGTWRSAGGLFANLNATYRDAVFQSTIDQTVRDIRPITLVNAKLGWQGRHFGAYLLASNIFDRQQPTSFFTDFDGRVRGTMSPPRILGLSFEGRF